MNTPWYRCFPRDFNEGMAGLTLEERGAYITIINLIYARGGPIPEDAWWITSMLGCTARVWTRLRAALILKRKLHEVQIGGEPHLMNPRAAAEITERQDFSENRRNAGKLGGRNSRPKPNENNGEHEAQLKQSLSTAKAIHIHSHRGSVVSPNGETTGASPPQPDPDAKAWAEAKALLVGAGGLSIDASGKFFGKLLATYGLAAKDLLGAVNEAHANHTSDPQGWLTKAAQARAKRQTGPPRRVGFV